MSIDCKIRFQKHAVKRCRFLLAGVQKFTHLQWARRRLISRSESISKDAEALKDI